MANTLSIDDPDVIDWYFEISSICKSSFFLVVLPFTKKTYLLEIGILKKKESGSGHLLENLDVK